MHKNHFVFLDGLRGIAALVVLLLHVVQQAVGEVLPFAALAVDFFYVLSGFVIAYAYEERLCSGAMSLAAFASVRFKRLYPLVFLSTAVGIVLALGAALTRHEIAVTDVLSAAALSLLLLPSFVFPQWATAYPFNMAVWSLTFEAIANAVYAAMAPWLSTRVLIAILLVSAALLLSNALAQGIVDGGHRQANFWYGFSRVPYPFFVGILAYRFRPAQPVLPAWLIVGSLTLALLLPTISTAIVSLLMVLVLFPMLVWAGSASQLGARLSSVCRFGGLLSYPVYICQAPVLRVGLELRRAIVPHGMADLAFSGAEMVAAIAAGWLAWRWFDKPIQQMVRQRAVPVPSPA
ncbi:acyltransferase [Novosphingobium sp. KCTC 2891]|uniref:acyltransferase family protein n=1 Tax=Novosphingobium sp. KCTC 2891 TaxID=2989730 RepID=UPI002222CCF4|nr:acyltransferase [Novosphingobium sp. KCTC 2891]MCW1382033.1 acyltransferase [Novosphingobium sp. KCTC 2891]